VFFDVSPVEMITIAVIAILVFGPDKLPKLAADAARMLRQFREFTQSARTDLSRELGPEFADLTLEDLNPRTFVRKNLLGPGSILDEDDLDVYDVPRSRGEPRRLEPGELPPYDPDAT